MEYDVINLSNGDIDEGGEYEFDGAHYTGRTVELPDTPGIGEILLALRDGGFLSDSASEATVYIHEWRIGADSRSFTLRAEDRGEWLFELRPTRTV